MPIVSGLYILFTGINFLLRRAKSPKIRSLAKFSHILSLTFMEMNLVDISFYTILNIFVFHKFQTVDMTKILSYIVSIVILISLIYEYGRIMILMKGEETLSDLEKEILHDGLCQKSLKKYPKLKYFNLIFRFNMVTLSLILIHLQLYLPAMAGCLILF